MQFNARTPLLEGFYFSAVDTVSVFYNPLAEWKYDCASIYVYVCVWEREREINISSSSGCA